MLQKCKSVYTFSGSFFITACTAGRPRRRGKDWRWVQSFHQGHSMSLPYLGVRVTARVGKDWGKGLNEGRSMWQVFLFPPRCKYLNLWTKNNENPAVMLSLKASRQVLGACKLVNTPLLRCFLHTSKPTSTFAKDLFLGRCNKVRLDFVFFCRILKLWH